MAEPRDLYLAYLRRCNEHRFDQLGDFVAQNVIVNGEPRGLVAYVAGLQTVIDAFGDYHWELRQLLVEEPWLSARLHDTGTHTGPAWGVAATGRRIGTHELALYRLEDGKIAEVWVTADNLTVLEQLRGRP